MCSAQAGLKSENSYIEPAERKNGQPRIGKPGPHSASYEKAAFRSAIRGSEISNEIFEPAIIGRKISNKVNESENIGTI